MEHFYLATILLLIIDWKFPIEIYIEILDFQNLFVTEPYVGAERSRCHMKVHTFLYKFAIDCMYLAHFVHTVTHVCKSVHRNHINTSPTWVISMSKNFPYFLVLETVESTLLSNLVFEILQLKGGGPWWNTLYFVWFQRSMSYSLLNRCHFERKTG